jgi:hypothetical protein
MEHLTQLEGLILVIAFVGSIFVYTYKLEEPAKRLVTVIVKKFKKN